MTRRPPRQEDNGGRKPSAGYRLDRNQRRDRDKENWKEIKYRRADNYVSFKLYTFAIVSVLVFVVLCGKILYEQNVHGEEYHREVLKQLINKVGLDRQINHNRGAITDRNMQPLALSTTVYNVYLDIKVMMSIADDKKGNKIREDTIYAINKAFDIPEETIRGWLKKDPVTGELENNLNYFVFAKKVPYKKVTEYETWIKAPENKERTVKYIYFEDDTQRTYIHNTMAQSVVGFLRGDSWGLEKQYNKYLTGTAGRSFRTFDSEGNVTTERIEGKPGASVVTTLDMNFQEFSEAIIEKYCIDYDAKNCSTIIMNPNTGEVLAMAEYPSVDANAPDDITKINNEKLSQELSALSKEEQLNKLLGIWSNFNTTYTLEPGSIFKPVTIAAALEEGKITLKDRFFCNGFKMVAGHKISCHNANGHGWQMLDQALANSCNVALMEIGEKMGRDTFYKYQTQFGYGAKTGIDLPAEGVGIIYSLSDLNSAELATSSFGQRFNCTPIQAITSFCAVINGGNFMRPYVVSQVADEKGNVLMKNTPLVERKVISKEVSDYMRVTMEKVVSEGTGKKAAINGYSIGGKTGTGEQGVKGSDGYAYTISFIGYFPVENPEYVVLNLIDKVPVESYNNGKNTAAPMFQELVSQIIKYKSIQPSYEVANGQQTIYGNIIEVGDYVNKSISEVTTELNNNGIDYDIIGGSGAKVTKQFPEAGSKISQNSVVYITVENPENTPLITVPDVMGLDAEQANKLLTDTGFVPRPFEDAEAHAVEQTPQASPDANAPKPELKKIYHQVPEAGVKIPKGTEIKLKLK